MKRVAHHDDRYASDGRTQSGEPTSDGFRLRFAVVTGLILLAVASRLLPHPPNFAPIGAIALFGGATFASRRVVYVCFALLVWLGTRIRKRRTFLPIAGATLAGSLIFFLATNFAVWLFGSRYALTWEGLVACYVAAIPFFHNTLLGNAFYGAALFGGIALLERRFAPLAWTAPGRSDHAHAQAGT